MSLFQSRRSAEGQGGYRTQNQPPRSALALQPTNLMPRKALEEAAPDEGRYVPRSTTRTLFVLEKNLNSSNWPNMANTATSCSCVAPSGMLLMCNDWLGKVMLLAFLLLAPNLKRWRGDEL